ncbi:hypothetical protein [Pedobacter psychroterrae]|uniref:DUF4175 family protein n=1 Tax=Pedobacter psychroterrae TaxID=2530453 RepID=A0A4V2MLR6_9SPHI|nr:hypothetical protein [Pedobacter psychroterrae]TCD03037.1 hypothetical protein EZ437_03400 [Pedobacter psychroterrae]
MDSNYDLLISKVNEFIQKFYLNKLLRGTIYAAALLLGAYLFLFLFVYYTNPGIVVKTVLFFSFLFAATLIIAMLIVKPALSYFKLGKNLSIQQAALLIGDHFFNVKDKLLNTLQLKALADQSPKDNMLILAGIDQKIMELKPIPFTNAIRFNENKKYVKYFLAPLSVIILIGIISPAILSEGTRSFVQYDKKILPKSPFQFVLLNSNLIVSQGDDVTIRLKMTGNEIPQEVYVSDGVNSYKLEKERSTLFNYTFKNLQKNKQISFFGGGFSSLNHTIVVKSRPVVINITARLNYPSYLNKKSESVLNAGDLLVPEGTVISWEFQTQNSDRLRFVLGDKNHSLLANGSAFNFKAAIRNNTAYQIIPENDFIKSKDVLSHQISVIKDEFPDIKVVESADSLSSKVRYFSGNISDDHGFSALKFHYNVRENGSLKAGFSKSIAIKKGVQDDAFFFLWNLREVGLKAGQSLEYYFELADNDGVNGPKKIKSDIKIVEVPTPYEVSEKIEQGSSALKNQMEKAIKLAAAVEKESKKITETLLDKKQLTFEDKKQVEQLLDKQKQLEDLVKEIKKLNERNTFEKEENNVLKDELAEKQKQIDDLFNNVLDDKTKALLEQLQKLMDQQNKDQTQNELSKMQMDNKSLKNELDRILELYKQLEFEQNLQNNIDRLKDLAKEQKELSKKTNSKDAATTELKNEQQKLSSQFEELEKELQKLSDKNQSLERPNDFKKPEKEVNSIKQDQKGSKENLDKNNKEDAAKSQDKAGKEMEELAKQMEETQQQSEEAENSVNAQELRQLLENLLNSSFDQEKVMLGLRNIGSGDPQYTPLVQKQRNIKDNMAMIADSLLSLSKKVPQIESAVNEEMQKINFNLDKSLENLGERNTAVANRNQQYTMTAINNLSLMLNEALDQLQNAKKKGQKGGSKGSKTGMQELQKMQQQLNQNMQKAKEQMQKNGNQGTVPKGQMSQEFGKMAQQQQMIRKALQKINNENKNGKNGQGNTDQMIKDMKATETDLVNKRIEQATMDRQKKLLDKLLDAENAEREEDEEQKRQSKAAKDFPPSYKKMLENFKKAQQSQTESLQKLPADLNHYYKNKIIEYFKMLDSAQ